MSANAFRDENRTMQARIESMKKQNWVESDEFVKANVDKLSPEVRDLLDQIFIADEFKRITVQVSRT
jgi:chemotaxis regulatin CheY-phosphate phosphatase CheZ